MDIQFPIVLRHLILHIFMILRRNGILTLNWERIIKLEELEIILFKDNGRWYMMRDLK